MATAEPDIHQEVKKSLEESREKIAAREARLKAQHVRESYKEIANILSDSDESLAIYQYRLDNDPTLIVDPLMYVDTIDNTRDDEQSLWDTIEPSDVGKDYNKIETLNLFTL